MYCPRCGQQQISEETRFCSRCGLLIQGLAEWLAAGGAPLARREKAPVSPSSPRRKSIRRGAKLMFLSGALFPLVLLFCAVVETGVPLVFPLFIFFVGLAIMLYARLFGDDSSPAKGQPFETYGLGTPSGGGALPPASDTGMRGFSRRQPRTAEMAQPPSVTENTTRLLDNE